MICVLMYATSNTGNLGMDEITYKEHECKHLRGGDARVPYDQFHRSMCLGGSTWDLGILTC